MKAYTVRHAPMVGLWRISVQSVMIFLAGLVIGIPSGFFQEELGESLGWLLSDLLVQVIGCIAVFFVCFLFSARWKTGGVLRSVLAVCVVQVGSLCLSIALGTDLPPSLILIQEMLVTFSSAVGGALAGMARARR